MIIVSILNFIIAELLFKKFNTSPEGDLSRLRSQLVKSSTLSEIGILLNLGDYLILGEGELKSSGWRRPSILADSVEAIIGAVFIDGGIKASHNLIVDWFKDKIDSINPNDIEKDSKSLLQTSTSEFIDFILSIRLKSIIKPILLKSLFMICTGNKSRHYQMNLKLQENMKLNGMVLIDLVNRYLRECT